MLRSLEVLGIRVERHPSGTALHIHTATERVQAVIEGTCMGERGVELPAGTLLLEHRELEQRLDDERTIDAAPRQRVVNLRQASDPTLSVCFELLGHELRATPVDQRVVRALCEVVLVLADRCSKAAVSPGGQAATTSVDAVRDLCVRKAVALLGARLAERWTVARLARELGLSRAALARRFALATGTSPLRYLAARRIAEAERLLFESDAALSEIARRVGYESEFAFSRAFKRLRGMAPGQFRRSVGKGQRPTMALAA